MLSFYNYCQIFNISFAALCQLVPCTSLHCSWYSHHPRSWYICQASLFQQKTYTLRHTVTIVSQVCIKDCCCQGVVEEGFQWSSELSWWHSYSLLVWIQYASWHQEESMIGVLDTMPPWHQPKIEGVANKCQGSLKFLQISPFVELCTGPQSWTDC